jgi:hypothetical protein
MARKTDYPTGNPNGMSFICNRWVFTGPQGYRVQKQGDKWSVVSYTATGTCPVSSGARMTEDDAHALAAELAGGH